MVIAKNENFGEYFRCSGFDSGRMKTQERDMESERVDMKIEK